MRQAMFILHPHWTKQLLRHSIHRRALQLLRALSKTRGDEKSENQKTISQPAHVSVPLRSLASARRRAAPCSGSSTPAFLSPAPRTRSRSRSPAEKCKPVSPRADCRSKSRRSSDTDLRSPAGGSQPPKSAAGWICISAAPVPASPATSRPRASTISFCQT